MKIPRFEDKDYAKCYCGKEFTYISQKCLHKLCDKCYKKYFQIKGARYSCPYCKDGNEKLELSQEDYIKESPLRIHYDEDFKRRNNIFQLVYKRKENFSSNEEYNIYLEFVEKCIQRNNEKEIEKKYPQTKKEREENDEKRLKELEEIKRKLRDNSPTHYNSSRFIIDLEGEIKLKEDYIEQNPITYERVKPTEEKIEYIKDIDKEKKTGGYDINKIYEFLSIYSKSGLISNTIKK